MLEIRTYCRAVLPTLVSAVSVPSKHDSMYVAAVHLQTARKKITCLKWIKQFWKKKKWRLAGMTQEVRGDPSLRNMQKSRLIWFVGCFFLTTLLSIICFTKPRDLNSKKIYINDLKLSALGSFSEDFTQILPACSYQYGIKVVVSPSCSQKLCQMTMKKK